jgi:hypothetical protein
MIGSKIEAMRRIADETDRHGWSPFPRFMLPNMQKWENEGLIMLSLLPEGNFAKITNAGRKLAKKAMAR